MKPKSLLSGSPCHIHKNTTKRRDPLLFLRGDLLQLAFGQGAGFTREHVDRRDLSLTISHCRKNRVLKAVWDCIVDFLSFFAFSIGARQELPVLRLRSPFKGSTSYGLSRVKPLTQDSLAHDLVATASFSSAPIKNHLTGLVVQNDPSC